MPIQGPWVEGYVLDYHTISSTPTGDPYYRFDTKRTELGELLYRLKYQSDRSGFSALVDTAEDFIRKRWQPSPPFDCIAPAPPSVTTRKTQPVVELARELGLRLGIPVSEDAVLKMKATSQMKNIDDWLERQKVLEEAIQKGPGDLKGKRVLLIDDLIESGSTLRRVAEVLLKEGGASAVCALALTRTK